MKVLNFLALALLCSVTMYAQQKQSTPKNKPESNKTLPGQPADPRKSIMDDYYTYVKKEVAKGKDILRKDDTEKLIEYFNTNGELRAKREKLYAEKYTRPIVFKSLPGESDRLSLLAGIPAPKDPAAALQADPRENEKYAEKIERLKEQAGEAARQIFNSTELAKTHERGGDAAVIKMYEKKANQSEIVREMGGVQALQNMSEKERAEAAKKMVADRTGGYTAEDLKKMTPEQKKALAYQMAANRPAPGGNEVGAAFTKELMVNESYRQRYEKMSNAEKQVEYKKFEERYNGGEPSTTSQNSPSRVMSENELEAREIFELNRMSEEFYKELKDLFEPIDRLSERYDQEYNTNIEQLMRWSEAEIEKLPTVSDSEYGPRKDGLELVEFTQAVMAFTIGKDKIAKQREVWEKYLNAYVIAFKKLDDMTAKYASSKNPSDRYLIALAESRAAGYDSIMELNKKASGITNNAGSIQLSFNCDALQTCHDPRQDKYSAGK